MKAMKMSTKTRVSIHRNAKAIINLLSPVARSLNNQREKAIPGWRY
jgi:hypothetical protein